MQCAIPRPFLLPEILFPTRISPFLRFLNGPQHPISRLLFVLPLAREIKKGTKENWKIQAYP